MKYVKTKCGDNDQYSQSKVQRKNRKQEQN